MEGIKGKLRNLWEWTRAEPSFRALLTVVMLALVVAILFWLYFNWWLPARFRVQVEPETPTNVRHCCRLYVEYPNTILVGDDRAEVSVVLLWNTATKVPPFTITIWGQDGLAVALPNTTSFTPSLTQPVTPTNMADPQLIRFAVRNAAKTKRGWLPTQHMKITPSLVTAPTMTVPVMVESNKHAALRNFTNSTVNERSPLILVVAALFSGATLLWQHLQKREENLRAERESKRERVAGEISQRFKNCLRARNMEAAKQALEELRQPELSELSDETTKTGDTLLQLAEPKKDDKKWDARGYVEQSRHWPVECIAAYIQAWNTILNDGNESNSAWEEAKKSLREARYILPINSVRRKHQYILYDLAEIDIRSLEPIRQQMGQWPNVELSIRPAPSSLTTSPFLKTLPHRKDPFEFLRAEDDALNLFRGPWNANPNRGDQPAFWGGHTLFRTLTSCREPYLVFGPEGSGRTAWAMALDLFQKWQAGIFTLYLPGQPDLREIRIGFSHRLLQFVQLDPTWLGHLGGAGRELLAQLLVAELGQDFMRAELEATQLKVAHPAWLKEGRESEEKRKALQKLAGTELQRLKQIVALQKAQPLPDDQWPRAFRRCVEFFYFNKIMFVADATAAGAAWARALATTWFRPWLADQLVVVLFLPAETRPQMTIHDGVTRCAYLVWSADDLRQMVLARYKAFVGKAEPKKDFYEYVSEAAFEKMICASTLDGEQLTPRGFFRVWQAMVKALPADRKIIVEQDVENILKMLDT